MLKGEKQEWKTGETVRDLGCVGQSSNRDKGRGGVECPTATQSNLSDTFFTPSHTF